MTPDQDTLQQLVQRLATAEQRIARLEEQLHALAAVGPVAWKVWLEERNWGIPRARAGEIHLGVCICSREPAEGRLAIAPKDELALARIPGGGSPLSETRWRHHRFDAWEGDSDDAPPMHVHADGTGLLEFGISLSRHGQGGTLPLDIVEAYVLGGLQLLLSHTLTFGLAGPAVASVAITGITGLGLTGGRRAWDMIPRDRRYLASGPLRIHREINLPQDAAQAERLAGEILIETCLAFNQPVQGTWQFLPATS